MVAPMPSTALRPVLWTLAGGQLVLGLWLAIAPGTFHSALADFGARDDHGLRDVATFYLAAGIALAIAAARPSWRVPVLALCALQYAFHVVNHLIDIGDAHPGWVGPFDALSLAATGAVFLVALRAAVLDGHQAPSR